MRLMEVVWTSRALRHLHQLPRVAADDVLAAVEEIAEGRTRVATAGRKLKRRAGHRLHVGPWRIIVASSRDRLTVIDVGHRATVYRR
jgi:mRNA-degrading endonuclease RelE of RelBE toxin-antitoxin system